MLGKTFHSPRSVGVTRRGTEEDVVRSQGELPSGTTTIAVLRGSPCPSESRICLEATRLTSGKIFHSPRSVGVTRRGTEEDVVGSQGEFPSGTTTLAVLRGS